MQNSTLILTGIEFFIIHNLCLFCWTKLVRCLLVIPLFMQWFLVAPLPVSKSPLVLQCVSLLHLQKAFWTHLSFIWMKSRVLLWVSVSCELLIQAWTYLNMAVDSPSPLPIIWDYIGSFWIFPVGPIWTRPMITHSPPPPHFNLKWSSLMLGHSSLV